VARYTTGYGVPGIHKILWLCRGHLVTVYVVLLVSCGNMLSGVLATAKKGKDDDEAEPCVGLGGMERRRRLDLFWEYAE